MFKKAQSGLEYLLTYGWAILIIIIVGAALYSSGVFSPSQQPRTMGFSKFQVLDYVIDPNGTLYLHFGSRSFSPLRVHEVRANCSGFSNTSSYSEILDGKTEKTFTVSGFEAAPDFYECDVTLRYEDMGTHLSHSEAGFVAGYKGGGLYQETQTPPQNNTTELNIFNLVIPSPTEWDDIIINWSTNLPANGTVHYRVNNGSWTSSGHSNLLTAHSINLGQYNEGDIIDLYAESCDSNATCVVEDNQSIGYSLNVSGDVNEPSVFSLTRFPASPNTSDSVTINATAQDSETNITGCWIRLDSNMTWEPMSASDGSYDEGIENVTYTYPPLSVGIHNVYIVCNDSSNNQNSPPAQHAFSVYMPSNYTSPANQLGIAMYEAFGITVSNTTGIVSLTFPPDGAPFQYALDTTLVGGYVWPTATVFAVSNGAVAGQYYLTDYGDKTWRTSAVTAHSAGVTTYTIRVSDYQAPYWPTSFAFGSSGIEIAKSSFFVGPIMDPAQAAYINVTLIDAGGPNTDPYVVNWSANENFTIRVDVFNGTRVRQNVSATGHISSIKKGATVWYDYDDSMFKNTIGDIAVPPTENNMFLGAVAIQDIISDSPGNRTTLALSVQANKPGDADVRALVELTVDP